MTRRGFRIATVVTFLVAIGVGPSAVASVDPLPTIDQIASAIQFRETFGLRADSGFVTSMASSDSADVTSYGVPLTADEVADLAARAKLREDFTPALAAAIDSPGYAGAYIDQLRHGQPVILTTNPKDLSAALSHVANSAALAEVQLAQYSLADLDQVKDSVEAAQKDLKSRASMWSRSVRTPRRTASWWESRA